MSLKFNEATHSYWLDRKPIPGVTTILGVLDKPALPKWAARSVAEWVADHRDAVEQMYALGRDGMVNALRETPWTKRDTAAARGTSIHDIADPLVRGEEVDVPDELASVAENILAFAQEWKVNAILTETPVTHRGLWYAGTLDLVADITRPDTGETHRAIIDYKSGKAIYPNTAWQLSAYGNAEHYWPDGEPERMDWLNITHAYGVHLRADGYDVLPIRYDPIVFDQFRHIRAAYDANQACVGNWRQPGSGYVGTPIQGAS